MMEQDEGCSNLSQSSLVCPEGIGYTVEVDYAAILLELKGLKIYDRINLATRLLPRVKKVKFTEQLLSKVLKFPFLDNLLLFTKFYK